MLRARLGTNVKKKDFIYKCHSGCRTDNRKRLLHTKFYTFTKTGGSKYALFFGSHNLTMNAARHQWNDLYLMDGNEALFDQYVDLFDDMKKDYEKAQPPIPTFCGIPANGVSCDDAVDFGTTVTFPRLVGTPERPDRPDPQPGPVHHHGGRRLAGPHQARCLHAHDPRPPRQLPGRRLPPEVRGGLPGPVQLRAGGCDHQGSPRGQDGPRPAPAALHRVRLQPRQQRQREEQPGRQAGPHPGLLLAPEVPDHPGQLRRQPQRAAGLHRLLQLGRARLGQRRDPGRRPGQAGRPPVPEATSTSSGGRATPATPTRRPTRTSGSRSCGWARTARRS